MFFKDTKHREYIDMRARAFAGNTERSGERAQLAEDELKRQMAEFGEMIGIARRRNPVFELLAERWDVLERQINVAAASAYNARVDLAASEAEFSRLEENKFGAKGWLWLGIGAFLGHELTRFFH